MHGTNQSGSWPGKKLNALLGELHDEMGPRSDGTDQARLCEYRDFLSDVCNFGRPPFSGDKPFCKSLFACRGVR